jgi:hypothetical protein
MSPDGKQQAPVKRRSRLHVTMAWCCGLALLVVGVSWFVSQPRHPIFGKIYETDAFDYNEAQNDRLAQFLNQHLPRAIRRQPAFADHFSYPKRLHVGRFRLEWSIGGPNTGWLYFHGGWAFAPCAETNLLAVTSVPTDFYNATDSARPSKFGSEAGTNAIHVWAGEVLYARNAEETNCVYILDLARQENNKLTVHYCVASKR